MQSLLEKPGPDDNKYSRGVVGFATGSESFPGAAILGVTAAMRTGVGMVRYLGPQSTGQLLIEVRPETVLGDGTCDAWVIGSGVLTDDSRIAKVLATPGRKVVDAGALSVENLALLTERDFITPHLGEAKRMGCETVEQLTALTSAVVLLKGNTTFVGERDHETRAIGPNSAELASAGTGDVLAGIIGALAAANPEADGLEIADLAVRLHSEAATRAALEGPVVALDVAEKLREVVSEWRQQ